MVLPRLRIVLCAGTFGGMVKLYLDVECGAEWPVNSYSWQPCAVSYLYMEPPTNTSTLRSRRPLIHRNAAAHPVCALVELGAMHGQ